MAGLFRSSERAEYDPEANTPLVIREYAADDDFSAFRSASALGGNEGERVNVTYVFSPVWPVPGKEEQIVGVLGRDKDVSDPDLTVSLKAPASPLDRVILALLGPIALQGGNGPA